MATKKKTTEKPRVSMDTFYSDLLQTTAKPIGQNIGQKKNQAVESSLDMTEPTTASFFQQIGVERSGESLQHNRDKAKNAPQAVQSKAQSKQPKAQTADNQGLSDLIARALKMRQEMADAAVANTTEVTERVKEKEAQTAVSTSPTAQSGFGAQYKVASDTLGLSNINAPKTTRVAAYIRVSTDSSDQENSYELQEKYFSQLLESNPTWASAGVYSDYGISGTAKEKRIGFRRLLRHCKEGKIDHIICKSISRFARNTEDFVTSLQALKACGTTIYFEKENLDTSEPISDFILTTLAAVAQEESRSISANIRWGIEKRYPKGDVRNYEIYGYRFSDNWVTTESGYRYRDIDIVEDEAAIVRRIFKEVADGEAFSAIARRLNYEHIPAPKSRMMATRQKRNEKGWLNADVDEGWTRAVVSRIVRSERYVGDVILQKTITEDHMTHKPKRNTGQAPQYHIQNHHKAIVDRETYDAVQKILETHRGPGGKGDNSNRRPFSGLLICGHCGRFFSAYNVKSNPIWVCPTSRNNNGKGACRAEKVYEQQIIRMFRKAAIERFRLTAAPIADSVSVDDIMSGRYKGSTDVLAIDADDFVAQMQARLEAIQRQDSMERDRAFLKRQVAAVQLGNERSRKRIRLLKGQRDSMDTRLRLLADDSITEEMIADKNAKLDEEQKRLEEGETEEKNLTGRLDYLESYWEELENDHEHREDALRWLEGLPKTREGTREFLNGLTADHVKAFVLSVTIHSPLKYTVHWFDDTKTDVEMYTNIEDFRYTNWKRR